MKMSVVAILKPWVLSTESDKIDGNAPCSDDNEDVCKIVEIKMFFEKNDGGRNRIPTTKKKTRYSVFNGPSAGIWTTGNS